jgi:hypothetical protein
MPLPTTRELWPGPHPSKTEHAFHVLRPPGLSLQRQAGGSRSGSPCCLDVRGSGTCQLLLPELWKAESRSACHRRASQGQEKFAAALQVNCRSSRAWEPTPPSKPSRAAPEAQGHPVSRQMFIRCVHIASLGKRTAKARAREEERAPEHSLDVCSPNPSSETLACSHFNKNRGSGSQTFMCSSCSSLWWHSQGEAPGPSPQLRVRTQVPIHSSG